MRRLTLLLLALTLAGCASAPAPRPAAPGPVPVAPTPEIPSARIAADNFIAVVNSVEPVAERICREERPNIDCDFQIVVDSRPDQPPNAFQTVDRAGRPIIAFTIALIADARNRDELAFILGHEAAHHIAGHLPRQQQSAVRGALLAGIFAAIGGGDPETVRAAQEAGASVGSRVYSKDFELEADALGTVIAFRAGYDPERGAAYFNRIDDPGNVFLGTHPPNRARIDIVRRTLATLR